jgi:Protein of unknown function (DUF550)
VAKITFEINEEVKAKLMSIGYSARYSEGLMALYAVIVDEMHDFAKEMARPTPLETAFEVAAYLFECNAYHKKLGVRLQDQEPKDVTDHMHRKVDELANQPDDIFELADILCLAASYAARKNYTPANLAAAMVVKMQQRFIPSVETADIQEAIAWYHREKAKKQ